MFHFPYISHFTAFSRSILDWRKWKLKGIVKIRMNPISKDLEGNCVSHPISITKCLSEGINLSNKWFSWQATDPWFNLWDVCRRSWQQESIRLLGLSSLFLMFPMDQSLLSFSYVSLFLDSKSLVFKMDSSFIVFLNGIDINCSSEIRKIIILWNLS